MFGRCSSSCSTWEAALANRLISRLLCVTAFGLPPPLRAKGPSVDGVFVAYGEYELGGETFGEPTLEAGADMDTRGGGIMVMAGVCS